jgi:hypothetical protein
MSVAWVGAGIAAVGTISQMDAASGAASSMQGGSDNAIQAQMIASAQMQTALKPWVESGGSAQNKLNQLLGLGGAGSGGVTSMGLQTGLTPDQVRQQLMSRYTRAPASTGGASGPLYRNGTEAVNALGAQGAHDYFQGLNTQGADADMSPLWTSPDRRNPGMDELTISGSGPQQSGGPAGEVDYEGLDAAIAKYYEEENAQNAAAQADPTYGSLLRAYRNGEEFDSGPAFSFTGENLASDPGYKFGLDQGTQGIERAQASRGNFLSGGAMKELARFNEDYAGTKFDNAFNRNLSAYGTNLNRRQNEWNTNLGAYNQNRNSLYDMLTGVSRTGQNSAAQVGTSNIATASNIGANMIGAGNAAAAGQVAGSNALVSGMNGVANAFAQNSGTNGTAAWNSMIAGGPTPYGANPTSVTGATGWVPTTNVFGGTNGRVF